MRVERAVGAALMAQRAEVKLVERYFLYWITWAKEKMQGPQIHAADQMDDDIPPDTMQSVLVAALMAQTQEVKLVERYFLYWLGWAKEQMLKADGPKISESPVVDGGDDAIESAIVAVLMAQSSEVHLLERYFLYWLGWAKQKMLQAGGPKIAPPPAEVECEVPDEDVMQSVIVAALMAQSSEVKLVERYFLYWLGWTRDRIADGPMTAPPPPTTEEENEGVDDVQAVLTAVLMEQTSDIQLVERYFLYWLEWCKERLLKTTLEVESVKEDELQEIEAQAPPVETMDDILVAVLMGQQAEATMAERYFSKWRTWASAKAAK
eukprot:TRINITY_DN67218_c4_g1_i1.p1 TRINITY_DN67218_c4_g1~~TRINITY_DN67218_c4_g1_i1.p1  ORF type:complete len:321 (+),score=57.21 TRINITY_DN67218_c4_g1_i1:58-1020(+)